MKTLFWKEVRENLKWALLASVVLTAAMLYALRWNDSYFSHWNEQWGSLCSKPFLLISSFGFPSVAIALGLLQILPELHQHRWAFLVHRPASRSVIFWGKACSGGALFFLAVIAPLFGVAWWASLPGSLPAPFDWGLVNAPLWDAIAALSFFFATLQSGLMSGPWFGRRLVPLIAVCFGAVAVKNRVDFPVAVTGTLTILFLSVISAWATFLSNGSFRKAPAWGKAAMAILGLFAFAFLAFWLDTAGWKIDFPHPPRASKHLSITNDGTPVIVTRTENLGITKVVTLDDVELHPGKNRAFTDENLLPGLTWVGLTFEPNSDQWRSSIPYFDWLDLSDSPFVLWYYVDRLSLFVGYGMHSKRAEAWLGPKGFSKTEPPEGFNLEGKGVEESGGILITEDTIWYRKNWGKIQQIYSLPEREKVLSVDQIASKRNDGYWPDFVLTTNRHVQIISFDGTPVFSTPQIANFSDYLRVEIYRKADLSRYFLIYVPKGDRNQKLPKIFLEVSASGEVLQKREVPPGPSEPWTWSLNGIWAGAASPCGERLWNSALDCLYRALNIQKQASTFDCNPPAHSSSLQLWGISLLFGIVCAGLGQILFKRLGIIGSSRWAWTVFLVFFSYAGLLALAILHEWPRRKRCDNCGRKRSIEASHCGPCGAPWPTRVPDGTEILELYRPTR